ncbi:1-acyl-sn-glycerol-3-phosphate acyltransferase [Croceivirga thetidis]|uniref:Glycerol acyltransferase n=1 Tax=Croceivirga thetidis TaxID=2721623 RepID=A0ABX1GSS0_9FLAO|nr:1-acyl-sn-glycerol-3-phosphate acyltransferase [Croceivirga thetidis]NKI32971.1 glycerol acyltransferase [Croceivirga thetidis]
MKTLGYLFFKAWVSLGLFFYYKKVRVVGVENIPKNRPVLFLSNHQNALLDIFLIATKCRRKPWYLTRADVFKSILFRPLFSFLQMLPIYRIRDGRSSLNKNKEIFAKCAQLLINDEAILLFPEANHSLKRKVRPLSKGFTRILEDALEKDPRLDIQIVTVGQNYQSPTEAGDSSALYFGKAIAVNDHWDKPNKIESLRQAVSKSLQQLTTHIKEEDYERTLSLLEQNSTNFLFPKEINKALIKSDFTGLPRFQTNPISRSFKIIFYITNFPMVFVWRTILKPKVPEPEFMATFRFGFVLLGYPFFYLLILFVLPFFATEKTALTIVVGHAVLNLLLVKIGLTSSHQRK